MYQPSISGTPQQANIAIQGLLLDIDRFASHDGPGIRTTVFLKGCPLSCIWCHSPESRRNQPELVTQPERCVGCMVCTEVCPTDALSVGVYGGKQVSVVDRETCTACGECAVVCYSGALRIAGEYTTVGEVVDEVVKSKPYFDSSGGGVTLSGGEPAAQPSFSYNFLKACQDAGVHTAVETTGYASWSIMEQLATVTDLFLFDVKFADSDDHQRYCGVPNRRILDNLSRLAAIGKRIHVRVPCIPGVNDSPDQIRATSRLVADLGITNIVLLPYNPAAGAKYEWIGIDFSLSGLEQQNEETMNALADICRQDGLQVQIGG